LSLLDWCRLVECPSVQHLRLQLAQYMHWVPPKSTFSDLRRATTGVASTQVFSVRTGRPV
jgi:hypothetical protein